MDPRLEHYTMYVDEANNNSRSDKTVYGNREHNNINSLGEFYVLPVDDDEVVSSEAYPAQKARVRLVGATNGNQLNYQSQNNEINLVTNFTNNSDQTKATDLLHTDV